MRTPSSLPVRFVGPLAGAVLLLGSLTASGSGGTSGAARCTDQLARAASSMTAAQHRACVLAVASTYLDARQHSLAPSAVAFDPAVAVHVLGTVPSHAAGNAARHRKDLARSTATAVDHRQWVIDGDEAFVSYRVFTKASAKTPASFVAQRFTLRKGLIWEVLEDTQQGVPAGGAAFPNTPVSLVTGPPAPGGTTTDYDDPTWCTDRIGVHGDASLTAAQHRRCMIAIATTYVDAEENTAPGNQILFDPRFCRVSLGAAPVHHPSNSDQIRTQEGTYQSTYNRTIRQITNRHWTVDGNDAWIVYDGYLAVSTTHPGFHVAERFTIRNGLIWEIMIAPVQTEIP